MKLLDLIPENELKEAVISDYEKKLVLYKLTDERLKKKLIEQEKISEEEAIQKMDDFKVVYIPDLRIDLGSQKYSPLECYEVFGGVVYSHFDRLVASMVEIVMTARKTSKLLLHTTGFLMKHFLDILKP